MSDHNQKESTNEYSSGTSKGQSADAPILQIENVSKSFASPDSRGKPTKVIENLSFSVDRGEFLTVLGSSGCGKTTLLRIICGLEDADSGRIILDGKDITNAEPNLRAVNTVFQSYALFPHMTVAENIAYPLKLRRAGRAEIASAVRDALSLVRMSGYERRYPSELSGGQRQRIAIARAVTAKPRILLLDEPLGALDLNLRREMQTELKNLQRELGITFIYITHDQEEALNMSDRIAVMQGGGFLQLDVPSVIYDSPSCVYVARFVGDANILPCKITSSSNDITAEFAGAGLTLRTGTYLRDFHPGDSVHAALRGEKITVVGSRDAHSGSPSDGVVCGTVTKTSFAGGVMRITADCGGTPVTAMRYGLDRSIDVGEEVRLIIPANAAVICADGNGINADGGRAHE